MADHVAPVQTIGAEILDSEGHRLGPFIAVHVDSSSVDIKDFLIISGFFTNINVIQCLLIHVYKRELWLIRCWSLQIHKYYCQN